MPRQPRLDIPHVLHHVIVRGIERRDIFADDADKLRFVASMSALLTKSATKCYAWALMSNHFHLLLMPTGVSLSETMRRLLTGYAAYFNRKHNRNGHRGTREKMRDTPHIKRTRPPMNPPRHSSQLQQHPRLAMQLCVGQRRDLLFDRPRIVLLFGFSQRQAVQFLAEQLFLLGRKHLRQGILKGQLIVGTLPLPAFFCILYFLLLTTQSNCI